VALWHIQKLKDIYDIAKSSLFRAANP